MAGAQAYVFLYLGCCLSVVALFAIGWALVAVGRKQEARRKAGLGASGTGSGTGTGTGTGTGADGPAA